MPKKPNYVSVPESRKIQTEAAPPEGPAAPLAEAAGSDSAGFQSFGILDRRPLAPEAAKVGTASFQILQNGANDQSSACETIVEVSPTSVLVLLGSCQSRLQREWA
jgi:hypothetical protein